MAKKKIGKKLTSLIIIALVFFVIAGLHSLGVFHFLEYKSYDMRVRFWADSNYSRVSDDIMVILLDNPSISWAQEERGWGWPWPREAYADIVNYMHLGDAKALAFDVIFSEPSVYRNARQDEIIETAVKTLEEIETENAISGSTQSQAARRQGEARVEVNSDGTQRRSRVRVAIDTIRNLGEKVDDKVFSEAVADYGSVVQTVCSVQNQEEPNTGLPMLKRLC